MARARRSFGKLRKLPSGRWQASYIGPDLQRHTAPSTFAAKMDGEAWLIAERRLAELDTWATPAARRADALRPAATLSLATFAEDWLTHRDLKPRTRAHYRQLLDLHVLPVLGDVEVTDLTPASVRAWHTATCAGAPTLRAHSYALLRTILNAAVADRIITHNPCTLRGAGTARRASKTEPASLEELTTLVSALPQRYRRMALLAAWCGLRFGELTELRGHDIDTRRGIIRVRRGVTWVDGAAVIGKPKSEAGIRDVAVPPHLLPAVREHLLAVGAGRDGLLFASAGDPTVHMRPATLYRVFYPARDAAGRPDLRFHDLRHTGAVLAASTGATLAELMGRLGHATPAAAMRYQHAARGRDQQIAAQLSELASHHGS